MPERRLNSEGGGHEAVCQQGRWVLKEVDWGVSQRLEKGSSARNQYDPVHVPNV